MNSAYLLRLQREKCAFLCCDIQSAFEASIHHFRHIKHTAGVLVQAAGIFGIPLIVSEQYPEKLGKTVIDVSRAHSVYSKSTFTMMNPAFPQDVLETKDTFILFGIETHVCIQQTALDLLSASKRVVLVTDAVSSSRPLDRTTALNRLSLAGAVTTTAESILFELVRTKDAPEFKQVSALAKQIAAYANGNQVLSSL